MRGDDQHRLAVHTRLRVVALLKAPARHGHDARLFVREVDLILVLGAGQRWLGILAPGFLALAALLLAPRHLRFVFLLLLLVTFAGALLNLGLGLRDRLQAFLPARKLRRNVHAKYASLSHSKWECKYHVVFIPKYRRKALYVQLRQHLGEVFKALAQQKESRVEEGHLMVDHVHMLLSIPPKYAVAQVVGFIKGKSAIHLARVYAERKKNFVGQNFWARGYFVSTVGRDEQAIRAYIREQEKEDQRLEQIGLWK